MSCLLSPDHLCSFSIQQQHCEIKNEDSKRITIKAIGEAKVLVNGEPVDDDEEEELHHLDRFTFLHRFVLLTVLQGSYGKSRNSFIHFPGLESHEIELWVMESYGKAMCILRIKKAKKSKVVRNNSLVRKEVLIPVKY